MNITHPYNNEIVVVNDFVTPDEIDLAMKYFYLFFNGTRQFKQPYQQNSDTSECFQLYQDEPVTQTDYQQLKEEVLVLFQDLQERVRQVFLDSHSDTDVEFTPLYNFSRLMSTGISPHADDCQPGATQKVLYGSILYWNDDFEGGELSYVNLGIDYKPVAGDLVFHPGTIEYTHGVKDVTSGIRYSSTTFIKSPL